MRSVGYLELLRTNRAYRLLWTADVASLFGDWFNTIALYTLVSELTGSPLAIGLVFIFKMLPFAIASPFAGWLTDRFNRRRLMIGADLLRALIVLGFLLVDTPEDVPLLYLLTALQIVVSSVFLPARTASIPNITSKEELVTANALSSATWSILLALGAALGGLAAEVVGVQGVFLFDSATYLFSALCLCRITIPQETVDDDSRGPMAALRRIVDGWRLLHQRPAIGRMALAKGAWALGGAGLVFMLTILGESWFPTAPSVGIGLLFGARGFGTGLGPIAARAWVPEERKWPLLMGICIGTCGLVYLAVALMPLGAWILVPIIVAHAFSGANWVTSTVLLQRRTEDHFRGRIFATEGLIFTVIDAAVILGASWMLEGDLVTLRQAITFFALLQVLTGLAWIALVVPRESAWAVAEEKNRGSLEGSPEPSLGAMMEDP